jgi:glycosyltransferase involved in cell wall biosynthesis
MQRETRSSLALAPDRRGVAVVVPAYDAAAGLGPVLAGVLHYFDSGAVFVIDDGSRDRTAEIARDAGVRLVQHPQNRGKGAALQTGFDAARRGGYTHVLTIDADGQHPPDCIPSFLAARDCGDIVIGSRLHDPVGMPRERLFSNRATAAILSALANQEILDGQSGYRLHALDAIEGLALASRGYMLESEILVRASRAGARIAHVPIPCIYGDQKSGIHPVHDTLRFLWLVVRSFFW